LDRLATAHRDCSNEALDPLLRKINSLAKIPVKIFRQNDSSSVFPSTSILLSGHETARQAMQRFSEAQIQRPTDDPQRSAYIDRDYVGNAVAFVIRMVKPGIDLSEAAELTRVLPGQPIPFVKLDEPPDIPTTASLHLLDPEQTVGFGAIAQRLHQHIVGAPGDDIPQLLLSVLGNAGEFIII
jgi:hypothetical protein